MTAYATELENTKISKAAHINYRFDYGLMNYRAFPPGHRKKIRTMCLLERVNKEVKRRRKKVGALPNEELLLRLAVSILIDINEKWSLDNRDFSLKNEMISLDTAAADFTAI